MNQYLGSYNQANPPMYSFVCEEIPRGMSSDRDIKVPNIMNSFEPTSFVQETSFGKTQNVVDASSSLPVSAPVIISSPGGGPVYIFTQPVFVETSTLPSTESLAHQYCLCDNLDSATNSRDFAKEASFASNERIVHYQSLEEIKNQIGSKAIGMTKEQMYDEMLKDYKYEKITEISPITLKPRLAYLCKYKNCDKKYTKIWNLLDHVRMHEGIRPFKCPSCPKSFTQKGNLKKHLIQHKLATLKERKRFKCSICGKGYTEKYNLEAHLETHME